MVKKKEPRVGFKVEGEILAVKGTCSLRSQSGREV